MHSTCCYSLYKHKCSISMLIRNQALLLCTVLVLISTGAAQQEIDGQGLRGISEVHVNASKRDSTLKPRRLQSLGLHYHAPGSRARPRALVSLLLDNEQHQYIKGATVLAKSVLQYAPDYFNARLLFLLKGRNYAPEVLQQAQHAGWVLEWVSPIVPPHAPGSANTFDQFAKLHLWNLERFKQVVYMDLDVALIASLTSDFISHHEYPTQCMLWAARDFKAGMWQDGFNMGVAGLVPNRTEHLRLLDLLMKGNVSFNGVKPDQDFFNTLYTQANGQWCELDFELAANVAVYSEAASYWMSTNPLVVHYTESKPWNCRPALEPICKLWGEHTHSDVYPVTVVSAYYSGPNKHGGAKYAEWGKNFLAHKMPLIIYTDDPAAVPGLSERDPNITKVVLQNISAFSMSRKVFDWDKQLSIDPERGIHSTHLFRVWLEKTNWVLEATNYNPFHSQHFVWLDFGCFRNNHWGDTWIAFTERFPRNDHKMLLLRAPGDQTSSPKRVGGMFAGSKAAWRRWSTVFYTMLRKKYREGVFIGDDQIPMTMLAMEHPNLACILEPKSIDGSDPWFFLLWYLAGKAPMQECSPL